MIMPSFVNVQRTLVNHPTGQYLSLLIGPDNKKIYYSNALREGVKTDVLQSGGGGVSMVIEELEILVVGWK